MAQVPDSPPSLRKSTRSSNKSTPATKKTKAQVPEKVNTPAPVDKPRTRNKVMANESKPISTSSKRKTTTQKNMSDEKINPEERHRMIAEAAYLRAERRGFADGSAESDWLEAEAEIDRLLNDPLANKSPEQNRNRDNV